MSNLPPKAEWSLLKSWLRLLPHSSTRHDGLLQFKTVTSRKPETEPYPTCVPIAPLFHYATTCYGSFPGNRPQHPRGLAQRIFSQPPRLSTSRLPLPHGSPRRSAKNALLYVTRTVSHSRASHHTQRLNRLSLASSLRTYFVLLRPSCKL